MGMGRGEDNQRGNGILYTSLLVNTTHHQEGMLGNSIYESAYIPVLYF